MGIAAGQCQIDRRSIGVGGIGIDPDRTRGRGNIPINGRSEVGRWRHVSGIIDELDRDRFSAITIR